MLPPLPPEAAALLGDDVAWPQGESADAAGVEGGADHDDEDEDDAETAALLQRVMALGLGDVHAGATNDIEWRVT